jgi:hypothetical protein
VNPQKSPCFKFRYALNTFIASRYALNYLLLSIIALNTILSLYALNTFIAFTMWIIAFISVFTTLS